MQHVSDEYKASMRSTLRDRGYMRVEFGFIHSDLQENAELTGDCVYFTDPSKVFSNGLDDVVYTTLEQDFTKVDGTMYFDPSGFFNYQTMVRETSFCSQTLIDNSSTSVDVVFSFEDTSATFDMITFNFGDNYPVNFTITDSDDNIVTVTGNDSRIRTVEVDFEDITSFTLHVTKMKNAYNRLRIYSVNFGTGLKYDNTEILDSSWQSSMSPINANLPQMTFSVKLTNYNHYFDPENPKSMLYQFNTSTDVKVYYGYYVAANEHIEWMQAAHLNCYSWSADYESVTIMARDILQTVDKDYKEGEVGTNTLYDLAIAVLAEMGVSNYTVSASLARVSVKNPIPRVSCREALQIIANAACMKLLIGRDGQIIIGDSEMVFSLTSNGTLFNGLDNILVNNDKYIYASLEKDFTKVDGTMYFDPYSLSQIFLTTGYVSDKISNNYGLFGSSADLNVTDASLYYHSADLAYTIETDFPSSSANPLITVSYTGGDYVGTLRILFGRTYASKYIIRTYSQNVLQEKINVVNSSQDARMPLTNGWIDKIEIEFIETAVPNNRVHIDYITLYPISDFVFTGAEMMEFPTFSKLETIKDIVVPYYSYELQTTEDKLLTTEIEVESTSLTYFFYTSDPCGSFRCTVSSGTVTIVSSKAYYVEVSFSETGTKTLIVYGKRYIKTDREVIVPVNPEGTIIKWDNPLIDSADLAIQVGAWVKNYYQAGGYYSFQSRGNPELDVNDYVQMENYLGKNINVLITDLDLGFNGAFSGNVRTLRLEDLDD